MLHSGSNIVHGSLKCKRKGVKLCPFNFFVSFRLFKMSGAKISVLLFVALLIPANAKIMCNYCGIRKLCDFNFDASKNTYLSTFYFFMKIF